MPAFLRPTSASHVSRAVPHDLDFNAPPSSARWRRFWHRLAGDQPALWALAVLLTIATACLFAGSISQALGVTANGTDLQDTWQHPSTRHVLGTDHLGRDVAARLLFGGRISLAIGFLSAVLSAIIGISIGMLAATSRGLVDILAMWLVNTLQSIPITFFLLVVAFVFSPSVFWIVMLLGCLAWTDTCRLVRGQSLAVDATDYVLASRALGASNGWIMRRHVLPNVLPYVVISTAIVVGELILFESALSYLGLGVQPPAATWGRMLSEAGTSYAKAPQLVILPGLAITITVLCCYTLGDGLRDALDPRHAH